jgi:hypothetical protein
MEAFGRSVGPPWPRYPSPVGRPDWRLADPAARRQYRIPSLKHLGLLDGTLLVLAEPPAAAAD